MVPHVANRAVEPQQPSSRRASSLVASIALVGAMTLLSACAETTLASQPPPPSTTTSTTTTTTVAPTTTTTTTTTTVAPTTTTTTTTLPVVNALTAPIKAIGRSSGDEMKRVQNRLLELGFWLKEADGRYGLTTQQAVLAFQKYHGLKRTSSVNEATAKQLSASNEWVRARSDAGTLAEIDKKKQLMFFVVDGRVKWLINVSTGSGRSYDYADKKNPGKRLTGSSITRTGLHSVYRQYGAGWWDGQLGKIYKPKYIDGGIAIHGYTSIPAYPASHGCVRVSTPAMDWIWSSEIMPKGIPVWVHEGRHQPNE